MNPLGEDFIYNSMVSSPTDPLWTLWDNLLSRDAVLIEQAYTSLDLDERQAVLTHLNKMAHEEGWLSQQRVSAQTALEVITHLT